LLRSKSLFVLYAGKGLSEEFIMNKFLGLGMNNIAAVACRRS